MTKCVVTGAALGLGKIPHLWYDSCMGMTLVELLFDELAETSRRLSGHEDVTVWYAGRGKGFVSRYTAMIFCKPRKRKFRIIRGHGRDLEKALLNLQYEVQLFEKGERDGEQ